MHDKADPSQLKPNPWNPNELSADGEAKLDAAIDRLGFFKPVIVRSLEDGTWQILGGEHRVESAKRLGFFEVPVFNVGEISDAQAKEIGLVDNGRYGEDDANRLAELLNELGTDEDLAAFLPYSTDELEQLHASVSIDTDDLDLDDDATDPDPEEDDKPGEKAPKTHQLMRFKVPVEDAERIAEIIQRVQTEQGFVDQDAKTNAGDALVHLLLNGGEDE